MALPRSVWPSISRHSVRRILRSIVGELDADQTSGEHREHVEVAILRTAATRIEARSSHVGSILWELDVDAQEMVSSVAPSEMRLDSGRLSTDRSPIPFWQYLDTLIVDVSSGEV